MDDLVFPMYFLAKSGYLMIQPTALEPLSRCRILHLGLEVLPPAPGRASPIAFNQILRAKSSLPDPPAATRTVRASAASRGLLNRHPLDHVGIVSPAPRVHSFILKLLVNPGNQEPRNRQAGTAKDADQPA